jgi:exopolyphosphatase/guanosine-5'-triphosphate,3'-diphosphate pyrophosphatase
MPRYAVVDVGTNSVKFHLGERRSDGTWVKVVDRSEVTRLGEGLDASGGAFTSEAIARTVEAIAGMAREAEREGAAGLIAVGTMGMRAARNRDELVDAVERRSGVRIETLTGAEEARLAYLAVEHGVGVGAGTLVVFDTGGGSTQFTFGCEGEILEQYSLNLGAVRLAAEHGLTGTISPAGLDAALAAIGRELACLDGTAPPDALVGLGGAMTNLTAVALGLRTYDPDAVQGAILTRSEVERQIELYRTTPTEARRAIVGLQPKRAEVILAGACVVRTVMAKLGKDELTVSDRGLRHGLLVERFAG